MSNKLRILGSTRALVLGSRPLPSRPESLQRILQLNRTYSDDVSQTNSQATRKATKPTQRASASAASKLNVGAAETKAETPKIGDQEELPIDRLTDAELEEVLYGGRQATSSQEGALTEAQEDALYREGVIPSPDVAEALLAASEASVLEANTTGNDLQNPGHKFALPQKPYPEGFNMKKRYHPVIEQITRILMRDGKLSVAQRNMAMVMNFLRTSPAPIYSPKFPLLPGTPPASHLPLNPVLYLTIAIDSVAPLVKINRIAGAAGGGRALELPAPLAVRQRRRTAFRWILDAVEKKPSKGSGRKQLAHRLAEEIIAVVEGRSGVWEKRKMVHKLGTATRANVGSFKASAKGKRN